jgi:hypothetical protein
MLLCLSGYGSDCLRLWPSTAGAVHCSVRLCFCLPTALAASSFLLLLLVREPVFLFFFFCCLCFLFHFFSFLLETCPDHYCARMYLRKSPAACTDVIYADRKIDVFKEVPGCLSVQTQSMPTGKCGGEGGPDILKLHIFSVMCVFFSLFFFRSACPPTSNCRLSLTRPGGLVFAITSTLFLNDHLSQQLAVLLILFLWRRSVVTPLAY